MRRNEKVSGFEMIRNLHPRIFYIQLRRHWYFHRSRVLISSIEPAEVAWLAKIKISLRLDATDSASRWNRLEKSFMKIKMNLIFWYESEEDSHPQIEIFRISTSEDNNGNWFFLSTPLPIQSGINITKRGEQLNEDNNDVFSYRLLMTVGTFLLPFKQLFVSRSLSLMQTNIFPRTDERKKSEKRSLKMNLKVDFLFLAHFSVICIHELNWILELSLLKQPSERRASMGVGEETVEG